VKLKLDENLGRSVQQVFANAGHDVETVFGERLSGADDEAVFQACRLERRCLVTLDLDFADPIRFQSRECGGIVVIRLHRRSSLALMQALATEAVIAMQKMPLDNGLWIVEPGRIRVHQGKVD
jgi:predicted nuclease of predicted toxin-antitoxin system